MTSRVLSQEDDILGIAMLPSSRFQSSVFDGLRLRLRKDVEVSVSVLGVLEIIYIYIPAPSNRCFLVVSKLPKREGLGTSTFPGSWSALHIPTMTEFL